MKLERQVMYDDYPNETGVICFYYNCEDIERRIKQLRLIRRSKAIDNKNITDEDIVNLFGDF